MDGLVSAELGRLGSSASSMTVIEDDEDVVSGSVSAGIRSLQSVLNALTLGERCDLKEKSRDVGATFLLNSFVSSKQKYPKI